jgi:hypothetical protein
MLTKVPTKAPTRLSTNVPSKAPVPAPSKAMFHRNCRRLHPFTKRAVFHRDPNHPSLALSYSLSLRLPLLALAGAGPGDSFQQPRTTGKAFAASYGGPVVHWTVAVLISAQRRYRQTDVARINWGGDVGGKLLTVGVYTLMYQLQTSTSTMATLTLCSSQTTGTLRAENIFWQVAEYREVWGVGLSGGRSLVFYVTFITGSSNGRILAQTVCASRWRRYLPSR